MAEQFAEEDVQGHSAEIFDVLCQCVGGKMVGIKSGLGLFFVSTTEEICSRTLKMDEDNVTKPSYRKSEKTQKEDERRKSIMG